VKRFCSISKVSGAKRAPHGSTDVRIAVDAGRALHGTGGVAAYTRELVRGLAEYAASEQLLLVDLDRGLAERRRFERALGQLPPTVTVVRADDELLRAVDLFHAPGFRMPAPGAARCIITLHDLTVISHPHCHTLANRARTLLAIAQAVSRGAVLLATTEATRDEAERFLSMPVDRVAVVPPVIGNVFTASTDDGDDQVVRGLAGDLPFVLAVASLEPRKNLDRLLDAWDLVVPRLRPEHRLVLVASDGWLSQRLRRRLRSLRRSGGVVVVSDVSGAQLAALYRRARALAYPSLVEGFGLPVAEAMACGTPVVTSNVSSMPEVARDAGLLVDPEDVDGIADALARVLGDETLRRDLRGRGIERAVRYRAAAVIPRLLGLYREASGLLG
jgi:alpha-1,3-rhamnosyl/mannosyltransferase